MESGKEEQHRNLLAHKGGVVARRVASGGVLDLEWNVLLRLLQNRFEVRSRSYAADINLVVPNAADHIHVDHGDRFRERSGRLLDPFRGAEEPEFFSSEVHQEDAALELSTLRREQSRQFKDSSSAA